MIKSWQLAAALVLAAEVAFSQSGPKPSQLGSVTQQVNETKIVVEYSRPVARCCFISFVVFSALPLATGHFLLPSQPSNLVPICAPPLLPRFQTLFAVV